MRQLTLRLAFASLWILTCALLVPGFTQAQTTNVIIVNGNPIISSGTTMLIEGNMIMDTNSTINNSGNIALTGNWVNNSSSPGLVNQSPGTVTLMGDSQRVTGTYSTEFYNLSLAGNGLKLLDLNTTVLDSLELGDEELSTENNTLTVQSNDAGIVTTGTGYVRSDMGGNFVRNLVGTGDYLFPVGSNTETKYRPVSIQNTAGAAQTFSVRMVDNDPDNDGYSRTSTDGSMCNINSLYYDSVVHISGSTSVNLTLFYDSTSDGSFHKIAHWNGSEWGSATNYSGTALGNLTGVTATDWNNFNAPILALADRYIAPVITPANNVKLCYGTDTVLTASSGYVSYHWSTGETTQSITVQAAGDYLVTGNLGNGSDCVAVSDTVHVSVQSQVSPTVIAGSATTFCQGGSVTLEASNANSYLWSNGDTSASITVNTSNEYTVSTTITGCSGSSSATTVTVVPLPATPTASSNTPVCTTSDINLMTPNVSGASYSWTGPNGFTSTQQNPVITNAATADSGVYSVSITVNNCGSPGSGSTDVAVTTHSPLPTVTKNNHILTSNYSSDNQWYFNGSPISGATYQNYTVTADGYYQDELTIPGDCGTITDSVYISVNGINNITLDNDIKVFPNPFNTQFMLNISQSATGLDKWNLNITDVLGKEIYVVNGLQYNNVIDLHEEASGVYFVTINTATDRKTFRLVKEQ